MSATRRKYKRRRSHFTFTSKGNNADKNTDADFDEFDVQRKKARKTDLKKSYGYDIKDKLKDPIFDVHTETLLKRLNGKEFSVKYCQETGFVNPILFESPEGLDIKMPREKFNVKNVQKLLGADRVLDVMDVETQKGMQMSLKKFVSYYRMPLEKRKRLWNVLSLEFSNTKMSKLVQAPKVIKELDWVELTWPKDLLRSQIDETNAIVSMKYPKVQNYCLMSVADCFTDFHVDFGGTSVWYHVLKGEKIFWLAPPSDENLQRYKEWTLTGQQQEVFFGDLVEHCVRIHLKVGNTFMIPSGWIHAVYTPVDSLVFGGNFLHSFAIPMQLRVFQLESNTRVPKKFRYPFFQEMQWYLAERYFYALTGVSYRKKLTSSVDPNVEKVGQHELDNKNNNDLEEKKCLDNTTTDNESKMDIKTMSEIPNLSKPEVGDPTTNVSMESQILLHDLPKITIPENPAFVPSSLNSKLENRMINQLSPSSNEDGSLQYTPQNLHKLTQYEIDGLRCLLKFLNLPDSKRHVPERIRNAEVFLLNLKEVLQNCHLAEDLSTLEGRTVITPVFSKIEQPVITSSSKIQKIKRRKMTHRSGATSEFDAKSVEMCSSISTCDKKETDFLDSLLNDVVSNVMTHQPPPTMSSSSYANLSRFDSVLGAYARSSNPQSFHKKAFQSPKIADKPITNYYDNQAQSTSAAYIPTSSTNSSSHVTNLPGFNVFLDNSGNNTSDNLGKFFHSQNAVDKITQQIRHLERQQQINRMPTVSNANLDHTQIRYIGSTAILHQKTAAPPVGYNRVGADPTSQVINFDKRFGKDQYSPVFSRNRHQQQLSTISPQISPIAENVSSVIRQNVNDSATTSSCSNLNLNYEGISTKNGSTFVSKSTAISAAPSQSVVSDLSNLMQYCEMVLHGRPSTNQQQQPTILPSILPNHQNANAGARLQSCYNEMMPSPNVPNHQVVMQRLANRIVTSSLPRSRSSSSQVNDLLSNVDRRVLPNLLNPTTTSTDFSSRNLNMVPSNSITTFYTSHVQHCQEKESNESFRKC